MAEITIERICENCGSAFRVIPSRLKHGRGRHCSSACQYKALKGKTRNSIQFTCTGCGTPFSRAVSVTKKNKGSGKYCTRACRDVHWVGPRTSNWQNGDKVYKRGSHWWAIRRRVLARDGACVCCGSTAKLHVHHVIPFRMFECAEIANDDDNLVALCPPCHRRSDARFKWVKTPESGSVLRLSANGVAWQMARDKGMI